MLTSVELRYFAILFSLYELDDDKSINKTYYCSSRQSLPDLGRERLIFEFLLDDMGICKPTQGYPLVNIFI